MSFSRQAIFLIFLSVHLGLLLVCGATDILYFAGANLCVEAGRRVILLPPPEWLGLAAALLALDLLQSAVLFRVFERASRESWRRGGDD